MVLPEATGGHPGGELQWGHGREAMDGRPSTAYLRAAPGNFNGAMAVRPWMATRRPKRRAPSTNFNGAMAVRPWMEGPHAEGQLDFVLQWGHGREAMDGRRYADGRIAAMDFNGAMAVRPWMALCRRYCRDGALPLQWGHGREAMDGPRSPTNSSRRVSNFNGAMAVRPWMEAVVAGHSGLHLGLQWGHGREAMDGLLPARRHRGRQTSMGPWP